MSDNKPGCLGIILQFFGVIPKNKISTNEFLPYGLRDDFLSPSELSFYKILFQSVQDKAAVLAKVSLSDIFFVKRPDINTAYNNKIARKHVDFLLCSPDTLKPIAGIELDDTSHQRADRVDRDIFVDEVFKTANIPLIRFINKKSYTIQDIKDNIEFLFQEKIEQLKTEENENSNQDNAYKPMCPKCGIPMVRRVVSKGPYKGKKFYGCVNFPKCREIIEI